MQQITQAKGLLQFHLRDDYVSRWLTGYLLLLCCAGYELTLWGAAVSPDHPLA